MGRARKRVRAGRLNNIKKTLFQSITAPCLVCVTPVRKGFHRMDNVPWGTEQQLAEQSARVIFLLRKLLDFPAERCADLSKRTGWVMLCSTCNALIEKGIELGKQIEEIEQHLDQVRTTRDFYKDRLRSRLVIEEGEEDVEMETEFGGRRIIDDVAKEVRDYLKVEGKDWIDFDAAKSRKERNDEIVGEEMNEEVDYENIKIEEVELHQESEDVAYPMLHFEDENKVLGEEICPDGEQESEPDEGDDPLRMESDPDYNCSSAASEDDSLEEEEGCQEKTVKGTNKSAKVVVRNRTLKTYQGVKSVPLTDPATKVSSPHITSPPQPTPPPLETDPPSYYTPQLYTSSWTWQDILTWRTSLLDDINTSPLQVPPLSWLSKKYKIASFPCPLCIRTFHEFHHWSSHEAACRRRSLKNGHKCPHCSLTYKVGKFLEAHVRRSHLPTEFLTCTGCNFVFDELKAFNKHVAEEKTCLEKAILCEFNSHCQGKYFQSKEALELHQTTTHCPSHLRPFACPQCAHTFSTVAKMNSHAAQRHGPEADRILVCELCGAKSKGAVNLRTHMKQVHESRAPGAKRFVCDVCGKGMISQVKLKRHKEIHIRPEDAPHLCPVCGKRFRLREYLRIHMWSHDPEKRGRYKGKGKGDPERRGVAGAKIGRPPVQKKMKPAEGEGGDE